ncbi:MAG: hypothetical protein QE487_05285 [Fluviicola sp.]|nr:hypothetical protein [Fluviicola sp.]
MIFKYKSVFNALFLSYSILGFIVFSLYALAAREIPNPSLLEEINHEFLILIYLGSSISVPILAYNESNYLVPILLIHFVLAFWILIAPFFFEVFLYQLSDHPWVLSPLIIFFFFPLSALGTLFSIYSLTVRLLKIKLFNRPSLNEVFSRMLGLGLLLLFVQILYVKTRVTTNDISDFQQLKARSFQYKMVNYGGSTESNYLNYVRIKVRNTTKSEVLKIPIANFTDNLYAEPNDSLIKAANTSIIFVKRNDSIVGTIKISTY